MGGLRRDEQNSQVLPDPDDHDSLAELGDTVVGKIVEELFAVDAVSNSAVLEVVDYFPDRLPPIRGQKPLDVFRHEREWLLCLDGPDQVEVQVSPRPGEPRLFPDDGEVLAGEAADHDVGLR